MDCGPWIAVMAIVMLEEILNRCKTQTGGMWSMFGQALYHLPRPYVCCINRALDWVVRKAC